MSLLPNSVVIAMLPQAGREFRVDPAQPLLVEDVFSAEMRRRVGAGKVRDWEIRWAMTRTNVFRTRDRWPRDASARIGVWPPAWLGSAPIRASGPGRIGPDIVRESGFQMRDPFDPYRLAREQNQRWGRLASDETRIDLDVMISDYVDYAHGPRIIRDGAWSGRISLAVRSVEGAEQAIEPCTDAAVEAAVDKALAVRVALWGGAGQRLLFVRFDRSAALELDDVALGVEVDLEYDGRLRETVRFEHVIDCSPSARPDRRAEQAIGLFSVNQLEKEDVARWTLRVRGSATESLREFSRNRYWAGERTFRLSDVLER